MDSFKLGAGATVGNWTAKKIGQVILALVLAGAARSGWNETLEQQGRQPDDGINFIPGVFYFGYQNVADATRFGVKILKSIKDKDQQEAPGPSGP